MKALRKARKAASAPEESQRTLFESAGKSSEQPEKAQLRKKAKPSSGGPIPTSNVSQAMEDGQLVEHGSSNAENNILVFNGQSTLGNLKLARLRKKPNIIIRHHDHSSCKAKKVNR